MCPRSLGLFGVNVINSPARAQGLLKGREEGRKREALVGVPCFSSPPLPSPLTFETLILRPPTDLTFYSSPGSSVSS